MSNPSKRPNRTRTALIIALTFVVALGGGGFVALNAAQRWVASNVETIGDPFEAITTRPEVSTPAPSQPAERTAKNILLLGSDSRISAGDPSQWKAGAQRTDSIMLVHLPADRSGAYVMSIPRDSWVDVPGHGQAKINAAFSWGGPSLLIETVEQLTQVRIDHFVVTDFEAFKTMTDSLGGVRMTLSKDLVVGKTRIPAGEQQLLTGSEALHFVRDRKSLPRGDFDRVQRQQAWIRAIVAKVRNDGLLHDPVRSVKFMDTVARSVATDDGLNAQAQADLRDRVKDLGSTDIGFFTMPTNGTGRSPDGKQSIVVVDHEKLRSVSAAIVADGFGEYLAANGGALDTLPAVVK